MGCGGGLHIADLAKEVGPHRLLAEGTTPGVVARLVSAQQPRRLVH